MEAVLDTGFSLPPRSSPPQTSSLASRHQQLNQITSRTHLLITLSDASLTVPLLTSLVLHEKLLAYQFAFDLVEGGAQDFLENIRNELPDRDEVSGRVKEIL